MSDDTFEGLHIQTEHTGKRPRGSRRPVKNALDIRGLALQRVRKAFKVLDDLLKDPTKASGVRLNAAKTVFELAKIDPVDVRNLSDEEVLRVAGAIMKANGVLAKEAAKTAKPGKVVPLMKDASK